MILRTAWRVVRKAISWVEKVLEYLAMAMLLAMAGIICYQIFLRFAFNTSPSWAEEVALCLMIWFGILSIPLGVQHGLHISIEYLYRKFPVRAQYVVSRGVHLLIAGFGVFMLVCGIQLVQFMSMSTMPATKLPSSVEYIVIPISGILLVVNALEQLFVSYARFLEQQQPAE
jgi:TRAP-type C4-dicarboxylate transport system permease small subunit